jgi:hypothetical protein
VSPGVEARSQTARSGRWCHGTRVIEYDPGTVSFFFPASQFHEPLSPALSGRVFSYLRADLRLLWRVGRGCVGSRYTQGPASIQANVLKIHPPYKPCTIGGTFCANLLAGWKTTSHQHHRLLHCRYFQLQPQNIPPHLCRYKFFPYPCSSDNPWNASDAGEITLMVSRRTQSFLLSKVCGHAKISSSESPTSSSRCLGPINSTRRDLISSHAAFQLAVSTTTTRVQLRGRVFFIYLLASHRNVSPIIKHISPMYIGRSFPLLYAFIACLDTRANGKNFCAHSACKTDLSTRPPV